MTLQLHYITSLYLGKDTFKMRWIFHISLILLLFHSLVYGSDKGVPYPLKNQDASCANALQRFQSMRSILQPSYDTNQEINPFADANPWVFVLKQIWGANIGINLPYSNASDLAEDMYRNPRQYSLVFYGTNKTSTGKVKFHFLDNDLRMIKIKANKNKTFYLHVTGGYSLVIYLVNETPQNHILSYVSSPTQTGILVNWFVHHISQLDWSLNYINHVLLNKDPIELRDIVETLNQDHPVSYRSSFATETQEVHLRTDLLPFFEFVANFYSSFVQEYPTIQHPRDIHVLSLSTLLAAFSARILSIIKQVPLLKFDLSKGNLFKNDKDIKNSQHHKLALTMLTGLTEDELMDLSKDFEYLLSHSQYGSFLRKVLIVRGILNEIESLKPLHEQSASYRQEQSIPLVKRFSTLLSHIDMDYQTYQIYQKKISSYLPNADEQIQNVYLIAMIKDQTDESSISQISKDEYFIRGQIGSEIRDMYRRIIWSVSPELSYPSYDYAGIVSMMAATSRIVSIEDLTEAFIKINKVTDNPTITIMLLRGLLLGYTEKNMIDLYQSARYFFKDKDISLINKIRLFTSGLVVDMKPEQVMSILEDTHFYLHGINEVNLTYFVDSMINALSLPYDTIITTENNQRQAVRIDAHGRTQPVFSVEIYDHIIRQIIYWLHFTTI